MKRRTILVAEDEAAARAALTELLEGRGYRVIAAENGPQSLDLLLHHSLDAALMDVRMPGLDGLTILKTVREAGIEIPMIIMTAYGDSGVVIDAMKLGAYDYLSKPVDFEQLLSRLEKALGRPQLSKEHDDPLDWSDRPDQPTMVGYSPAMQHVYKLIGQAAATDATVMIRGESGTGKELVVNAIHHNSRRRKGPLIKVNAAAIPATLLEDELFGHEKGAFTNATARRLGRFKQAHGGTLFLDEIGDLDPLLQAKLLRAVQERTIERLGSSTPIQVDLRLITATARNLESAVSEGSFREDLYYRLNVIVIELPPLRDRRQDIPLLVQHFLNRGGRRIAISQAAMQLLCEYHWPGNVRELENTVERAAMLARGGMIDVPDIQLLPVSRSVQNWTDLIPIANGWRKNLADAERAMLVRALSLAQGNKTKAAELLGINRRLIYEKMREYEISDAEEIDS
jgi:DNA-binding NtrC family response regulator